VNLGNYSSWPGAIIGDGDRKPWDPRAPMIWDKFSIFKTNCAILTSYIRADPRTCWGLSRGCCHVAWSNGESWETLRDYLAYFSQRSQGIRQGIRTTALICSFMLWANGKGGFFRVENKTSISPWEWIIRSAHASCKLTRMFLRLFWLKNSIFRTNCAIACGTRAYMLRGFLRMSRGGNRVRNSRNFLFFWPTTQRVYVCWNFA